MEPTKEYKQDHSPACERISRMEPLFDHASEAVAELLSQSDVIFCCLNKNTVLLHEEEFSRLGRHKVLFNTGLSPAWDEAPFLQWLEHTDNICYCDTVGALGGSHLLDHPRIRCMQVSTGRTRQAFDRLSESTKNGKGGSLLAFCISWSLYNPSEDSKIKL